MFGDFFKKSHVVFGMDISSTSVKLLQLSKTGSQYTVVAYAVAPFPPGTVVEKNIKDVEAVRDAVRTLMKRAQTACRDAVIAVPSSAVITKIIQAEASLSEQEMESQIAIEANRYISYPMDEVYLDFQTIGISEKVDSLIDVLLVASRKEYVKERVNIIEDAGVKVQVVDVESYVMERVFSLLQDQVLDAMSKTIVIIDIGATTTTLTALSNGMTIYTREELFGGKLLTEQIMERYGLTYAEAGLAKKLGDLPEDYVPEVLTPFNDAMIEQISRALQFFSSSTDYREVDHIFLGGGSACIPGTAELVQERVGIRATIANPFANMAIGPGLNASALENDAPALLMCAGLALRGVDDD